MGQILHGSATTTAAIRRAIQPSQASLRELASRYGINRKTVAKWRTRDDVVDRRTGPRAPHSTVLTSEEEAIAVAFRQHTLLALDGRPLCPSGDDPAPDTVLASSLLPAPRRRSPAGCRRRQTGATEVQGLPHRLLPHRYRRGSDRSREALYVRRRRPDLQGRPRQTAREG
jgi:hypothetical protein